MRLAAIALMSVLALSACGKKDGEAARADAVEDGIAGPASSGADGVPRLEVEPIPSVETLPSEYPDSWFFAHDVNFFNMIDGKVVVLDAAAETREYKGQLPAGLAASFAFSSARNEIYVAETIHEKRVRGPRHDFLTIYDVTNLQPVADIEIPNTRYQGMPYETSMQLIDGDRFALVFHFSPAASVTVVDLVGRKVVSEIPIPGCAMIYPTGQRGFSTLCGNGGMATMTLTENGQLAEQFKTGPFNNIDENAMFMAGVEIDGVYYFPTFLGDIIPIDLSGEQPVVREAWSLFSDREKEAGMRPGGWQLVARDDAGSIYVIVHPDGAEGTHKNPGAEIYVYSAVDKKRQRKIELINPAISIMVTGGDEPYLVAFNANLELDIYDAKSGEWLRKIGGLATETAFGLYRAD